MATITVKARKWMERGYFETADMPRATYWKWMDENPERVFEQALEWISNVGSVVETDRKHDLITFEPWDEYYTDELAE